MLKKIIRKLLALLFNFFAGIFWYTSDFLRYWKLRKSQSEKWPIKFFPKLFDKDPQSHTFDKHYVYMDRWAFKKLQAARPIAHVDVGSSIRFLSMASTVTNLKFVDIRPIKLDFENFECIEGSILDMPFKNDSVLSLSCLHVAEHIGLGRYGDPLDPSGTKKACKELSRVLAPGGLLYFALPVGKPAVYFNAHRIHSPQSILDYFEGLKLLEFSGVNDTGHFVSQAELNDFKDQAYACGMFLFTK